MSYYFQSIGKKADVIASVKASKPENCGLPESVGHFLVTSIAAIPDPGPTSSFNSGDSVLVEAQGHEPGTHSITIKSFTAAKAPEPPAQPTA